MLCVVAYSMEDRRANTRTNCLFTLAAVAAADRYEAINLCERTRTDSHIQKHARSEGCGACFNTDRSICTLFMCVYGGMVRLNTDAVHEHISLHAYIFYFLRYVIHTPKCIVPNPPHPTHRSDGIACVSACINARTISDDLQTRLQGIIHVCMLLYVLTVILGRVVVYDNA